MSDTETSRTALPEILDKPIRDLGLKIEGSPLEHFVQRLYRELESKKLMKFHPACYLTDEWGCPSGEPVIGIPFYLANPQLAQLEKETNDLEDAREIMMYLRHEAGHAFNYAYKLHRTPEWKQLFGPFRRPYHDNYRPVPFSRNHVRYLAGWYAQKHPDEDFAETFRGMVDATFGVAHALSWLGSDGEVALHGSHCPGFAQYRSYASPRTDRRDGR